jgi:glycosyltransferase involved in cell wall biosynthesis
MPRVLLHAFSTFKLGGPQARFVELANAFGPRYRHVVVAMDDCFDAGARLDSGLTWQALRLPNQRGGLLANRAAFRAQLQAVAPDMLFSYNWGAIEWAAGNLPRKVPQVHVEDGFGPEEAQGQLPRRVWTRRVLLGWPGVPVVVASRNLERIARDVWRLPGRQVRFVPNGVALLDTSPRPLGTAGPLVIGTVAGLRPEKNVARLVRAFAALRAREAARLVVLGDGPERERLEALAAQLGVAGDVEFAGYVPRPQERLPTFDLFALSSNTEQLPIAMLEAMACGVPVVATRVGDVPHIVPPVAQAGLSAPEDAAFTAALLAAVDARAQWPAWRAAGLDQVRTHYTRERMLADWGALFDGRLGAVFAA